MNDPAPQGLQRFIKPFFALTREERQALCLVLALALLGLAAWVWHRDHRPSKRAPTPKEQPAAPMRTSRR